MLKYEDLTLEEKDFLTDDCGNHLLDVPDFMWTEACRKHDFGYWLGFTEKDRRQVDGQWLREMLQAVNDFRPESLNYASWVYKAVAIIYWTVVRVFSWRFFEYGDRYKTKEDLKKEMENKDA